MRQRLLTWLTIGFAAAAVAFGGLWLQERARARAYRDATVVRDTVAELGAGFEGVRVVVSSHPRANVLGRVDSDEDLARLNRALNELDPSLRSRLHVGVSVRPAVATDGK